MNILFIIKVKVPVFIKWSYRSFQFILNIEPRMVSIFEHVVESLSNTFLLLSVLRSTPNHIAVKPRCPIKCTF